MTTNRITNWRIASTRAALPRGIMMHLGINPPVQYFPRDYSVKTSDALGGAHRSGYLRYELLWTRMDVFQNAEFHRIYNAVLAGDKLLRLSALWWDTSNPVTRWVDLEGRPDISDPSPNPPAFAKGTLVYSTINLTLNNVVIFNDPATY